MADQGLGLGVGLENLQISQQQPPVVDEKQGNRVHIGNLAWASTKESLTAFFLSKSLNVLNVEVMVDYNGRSKGWGLAEFATGADVATCIATCNEVEVDGRAIRLREDRGPGRQEPRAPRAPRAVKEPRAENFQSNETFASKPQRRSKEDSQGCRVFVSNLSWQTQWQGLKEHFRSCGEVLYANVLMDYNSRRSKGCGVVEMSSAEEAAKAIAELTESDLDGRNILVRADRDRDQRQNNN